MNKRYKRVLVLFIVLISSVFIFSGCIDQKSEKSQNDVAKNVEEQGMSNHRIDYSKLLPGNYDWDIVKTTKADLNSSFTIVGAYCERNLKPMLGQFFVFSQNNKLLWKSTEFETSSILDEDIYVLKVKDKLLVLGEYIWGGAQGMMYSGDVFSIDTDNAVKEENKDLELGLDGNVTVKNSSILLEGELIHNQLELTLVEGIYRENTLNEIKNQKSDVYTITDFESWKHPVKTLLDNYYNIELHKVELLNNRTYPVFYFKYSGELIGERDYPDLQKIAKANGYWNYRLVDEKNNSSVEVFCDRKKKRVLKAITYTQTNNGEKPTTNLETDKFLINSNVRNKLSDNDFKITINGVKINYKDSVPGITDKIGTGSANEDNNFGYIGRAPDGHDRHIYRYPEADLISIDDGDLERIDLLSTIKGLNTGDDSSKLIKLYGKPNFEILKDKDSISVYVYSFKDKQFIVGICNDKIEYISLQFMNLYEF